MQTELGKNLCGSLLKDGLISQETAANHKQFQRIVNELLECFPPQQKTGAQGIHNLKKKLGKMLSMKAREMKVSDELLKKIKALIYLQVSKKLQTQVPKRKLKFGVKREVYSSDQSQAQNPNSSQDTGSAQLQLSKKQRMMRKRKYKTFDQDFKQEVCQVANKDGIQYATQKYNLSTRKVSSWLEAQSLNLLGKGRKALDPAMQFNMSVWILNKIWNQVPLTQKVIRQKAATMKTINIKFNGSKGWLQKFFLRHVQLKSCFDTRNKAELKDECAKYHRSAFARVLKDYENLVKMGVDQASLVGGDFSLLIYGTTSHPHLKLEQDQFIDKQRIEDAPFYDYQKLKNMPSPNFNLPKKQEQDSDAQPQQSEPEDEEEFENSSQQDLDLQSEIERKNEESSQQIVALYIYEEDDSDEKNSNVKVKIEQSFAP